MTLSEAVKLVLLAVSFARAGDVFVFDMDTSVPIRRWARNLIETVKPSVRAVAHPNGQLEIKITGLHPGQKLREDLRIDSDMVRTTHSKIVRARENHLSELDMATGLQALRQA